jgi:pyruvate,water dikinase
MYPYYALFDERRRDIDENRFWFWNSMHFPMPMPAFDVICIDSPYQAVGSWQNRVFAVPPAMGIDYRCINGYIYISGNPVTDPEKIGERAEFFQRRAGYYFQNWSELYGKWRAKMEALIRELGELEVPDLPEYEPDEVAFGDDRNTAFYEVLDAYGRALRLGDLMWQHHFEFLLLGYGAYGTFVEFCKGHLPDIPDQHIAQMVAGLDVLLFRPDAELRRLARLAIESGVDSAFVQGRLPQEIDAELAQSDGGRSWLEELEKVKDPWFNMATGDGLYHYYRSWLDDPSIPYASLIGHISALNAGEQIDRPTEEIQRERDRLATEYGALLDEQSRASFNDLLNLSRTVFPYVEEHKFFCDYWFLTRWWNKIREFGALLHRNAFLEDGEDVFHLSRYEVASALDELVLTWATGGLPLGPKHWPPIVARRKEILKRLGDWTPPPAVGVTPEAVTDPMTIMLWGVTTERVREWSRQQDGGSVLSGAAASPGVIEGVARVVRSVDQIRDVRDGEILVCGSTSPAWAPIFSKIKATVTDVGGVMSHAAIVAREYGLPAVVGTGRATAQIRTGQTIRVDGTEGTVTLLVAQEA